MAKIGLIRALEGARKEEDTPKGKWGLAHQFGASSPHLVGRETTAPFLVCLSAGME